MAKETDRQFRPDTDQHARTRHTGKIGDRRDVLLVPGTGIFFSKLCMQHMASECYDAIRKAGQEVKIGDGGGVISEELVLELAEEIKKGRQMQAASQRHAHEAKCYAGTDTNDPARDPKGYAGGDKRNAFELDRSGSTVSITVASGHRRLNGSEVEHQYWMHLQFETPDGNRYAEVAMTFDQFAAALVSNRMIPCTFDHYWSVEPDTVGLREVVKEPDRIDQRMEQRLNDRLDEADKQAQEIVAKLQESIAAGKTLGKKAQQDLAEDIGGFVASIRANRKFTVDQALEETAAIVERAAISIAWEHRLSPEQLAANAPVGALLKTLAARKALPAPAPKATHHCKICGALWKLWAPGEALAGDRGSWSLVSKECGKCCDNEAMGDQIEALPGGTE